MMYLRHPIARTGGFSLIELAIVVGVAGAILGGVWAAIQSGNARAKVAQSISQVLVLNKNIRSFYQKQACIAVAGDLTPALLAAVPPVIPRDMIRAGAVIHPWEQPFSVRGNGAAGCGTMGSFQFMLRYQNLPQDACIELVLKLTAPGETARGLVGASINATALTSLPPNPAVVMGTAAGSCGQAATATVDLIYNLRSVE